MSVASRILSILRSQALATSRTFFERARGHREPSRQNEPRRATGKDPKLATYYANLEIPYGAGREEVESAWKRQARRYHPDRHATDPERQAVATELLQGINHAYTEICRHLASSKR